MPFGWGKSQALRQAHEALVKLQKASSSFNEHLTTASEWIVDNKLT